MNHLKNRSKSNWNQICVVGLDGQDKVYNLNDGKLTDKFEKMAPRQLSKELMKLQSNNNFVMSNPKQPNNMQFPLPQIPQNNYYEPNNEQFFTSPMEEPNYPDYDPGYVSSNEFFDYNEDGIFGLSMDTFDFDLDFEDNESFIPNF